MIDAARLKELEDDFGAEDLDEIIEAFLDEAEEALGALAGMLGREAETERAGQLHFLKGCARNIGARDLGDVCEALESGSRVFSAEELADLRASFEAVRAYFDADPACKVA